MEKRTMADVRREKFNKQGKIARDLADLALRDIDDALAEHSSVFNYEHVIGQAVMRGEIDAEEGSRALANYEAWITTGDSRLRPITDYDTLASPIGYYMPPDDAA